LKIRIAIAVFLVLIVLDVGVSLAHTMKPVGIVVHHTALADSDGPAAIAQLHKDRGFGAFYWWREYYIGYHYLIMPDGTIVETRPEHLQGAHATTANDTIGICLMGNFDEGSGGHPPTPAQMKSLTLLTKKLMQKYQWQVSRVHRHLDINSGTLCPGNLLPWDDFIHSLG